MNFKGNKLNSSFNSQPFPVFSPLVFTNTCKYLEKAFYVHFMNEIIWICLTHLPVNFLFGEICWGNYKALGCILKSDYTTMRKMCNIKYNIKDVIKMIIGVGTIKATKEFVVCIVLWGRGTRWIIVCGWNIEGHILCRDSFVVLPLHLWCHW